MIKLFVDKYKGIISLDPVDRNEWTPLHCACISKNLDIIIFLLENGADPTITTGDLTSPLHYLVRIPTTLETRDKLNQIFSMLVRISCPMHIPNANGKTTLHEATSRNQRLMVCLLLKNGAKINAVTKAQETALHYAVTNRNIDICKILLELGADIAIASKEGTAIEIAQKFNDKELIQLLQEYEKRPQIPLSEKIAVWIRTHDSQDDLPFIFNKNITLNESINSLPKEFLRKFRRDCVSYKYGDTILDFQAAATFLLQVGDTDKYESNKLEISKNTPLHKYFEEYMNKLNIKPKNRIAASIEKNSYVRFGNDMVLGFLRNFRFTDEQKEVETPDARGELTAFKLSEFTRIPNAMGKTGGLAIPLRQSEAMWLWFDANFPHAIEVTYKKKFAVNGILVKEKEKSDNTNYIVCPQHHFLAGVNSSTRFVEQFVPPLIENENFVTEKRWHIMSIKVTPFKLLDFVIEIDGVPNNQINLAMNPKQLGLNPGSYIKFHSSLLPPSDATFLSHKIPNNAELVLVPVNNAINAKIDVNVSVQGRTYKPQSNPRQTLYEFKRGIETDTAEKVLFLRSGAKIFSPAQDIKPLSELKLPQTLECVNSVTNIFNYKSDTGPTLSIKPMPLQRDVNNAALWDYSRSARIYIHILNSKQFEDLCTTIPLTRQGIQRIAYSYANILYKPEYAETEEERQIEETTAKPTQTIYDYRQFVF
eukprot:TRINITY_DN1349_c0_g1_i1.p1 TRINITY_DN1349_c0_g1~~TRINITY_DN1349_c0_g1_i1.p1  ORF type:complete len:706 (-),score=278.41 TRINITY_DN1349_c0_g1_i1:101-2218(-)